MYQKTIFINQITTVVLGCVNKRPDQRMNTGYINEFAKLAGVSARMLRHYDKINLLKPSIRQENGYRLYSSADFTKLQKILALKFLGFQLGLIRSLLSDYSSTADCFLQHAKCLKAQSDRLEKAEKILVEVIETMGEGSIPWKKVFQWVGDYSKEATTGPDLVQTEVYKTYLNKKSLQ